MGEVGGVKYSEEVSPSLGGSAAASAMFTGGLTADDASTESASDITSSMAALSTAVA